MGDFAAHIVGRGKQATPETADFIMIAFLASAEIAADEEGQSRKEQQAEDGGGDDETDLSG